MSEPQFNQSKIADPDTAEYIGKMFDRNRKHLAMLCQIDPETYSLGKDKLLDSIQLFAKCWKR